jgi:hypothetical protein
MRCAVSAGLRVLSRARTGTRQRCGTAISTTPASPLALTRLPEPGIEPVPADVGRARQHVVDGTDAPASAVAGADAGSGASAMR